MPISDDIRLGAMSHDIAASADSSFFSRVGDAVTMGLPAAIVSGAYQLVNSASAIGKFAGFGDGEQIDIAERMDDILGISAGDYYRQNQTGVDFGGFLVSSIIPGGLAVKGLRAGQAGLAALKAAELGQVGSNMSLALRLMTGTQQQKLLTAAKEGMELGGLAWRQTLNLRVQSVAAGSFQTALEFSAAETLTQATLNQSPIYAELNSPKDWVFNSLSAGAFGLTGHLILNPLVLAVGGGKLTAMKELYATREALDTAMSKVSVSNGYLAAAKEPGTRLVGTIMDLREPPAKPDGPNFTQQIVAEAGKRERALEARAIQEIKAMLDPKANITAEEVLTFAKTAPQEAVNGLFTQVNKLRNIVQDDLNGSQFEQFYTTKTPGPAFASSDRILDKADLKFVTVAREKVAPSTITNEAVAWERGYAALVKSDGVVAFNPKLVNTNAVISRDHAITNETIFDTKTGMLVTSPVGGKFADFGEVKILPDRALLLGTGARILPYKGSFVAEKLTKPVDLKELEASYYLAKREKKLSSEIELDNLPMAERIILSAPPQQEVFRVDGMLLSREDATRLVTERKEEFLLKVLELNPAITQEELATATYSDIAGMMGSQDFSRKHLLNLLNEQDDVPRFWKLQGTATKPHDRFELLANSQVMERHLYLKEEGRTILAAVVGNKASAFPKAFNVSTVQSSKSSAAGAVSFQDADFLSAEAIARSIGELGDEASKLKLENHLLALESPRHGVVQAGMTSPANIEGSWIMSMLRDNPEDMILVNSKEGILESKALDRLRKKHARQQANGDDAKAAKTAQEIAVLQKEKYHHYHIQEPATRAYIAELVKQLNSVQQDAAPIQRFRGLNTEHWAPNQLLAPPVDIGKRPYVAFVSRAEGSAGYDGEIAVITARSDAELKESIARIKAAHPDWQVRDKREVEDFYVAKSSYEFAQSMTSYTINSTLRREGKLVGNLEPRANFDWINEFEGFIAKQTKRNVREAIRAQYAREIAELELRAYADIAMQQSATGYKRFGALSAKTPYTDVINNMLFINPATVEDNTWNMVSRKAEEVLGAGLQKTDEVWTKLRNKEFTEEEARKTLDNLGFDQAFAKTISETVYKSELDSQPGRRLVAGVNNILSFFMLRADFWQPFVNAMSLPILANPVYKTMLDSVIRKGQQHDNFFGVAGIKIPGGELTQLSGVKVAARANKRMWDKVVPPQNDYLVTEGLFNPGESYTEFYTRIGILPEEFNYVHTVLDTAADFRTGGLQALAARHAKMSEVFTKVQKVLTKPSDFAEKYTRFISADMAMQLAESVKVPVAEIPGFLSLAVAQMNGQYRAFQRPQVFQGILGQTISLFQSYQFNFIQRYLKFLGAGDTKAMLMMSALQSGIYGMRGLPYFDVMNRHLIGERNSEHADIYTGTYSLVGKELGDFVTYGAGASVLGAGIHTRGEVTPRSAFILPTSPAELPQVALLTNTINAMGNFINKLENGAGLAPAFLQAVEHNGISRPLQGVAAWMQGFTTTRQGNLQTKTEEQGGRGLFGGDGELAQRLATVTRVMGSRPLSESIYLDTAYRYQAYQKADADSRNALGNALTLRVADLAAEGQTPDIEVMREFLQRYTETGGNIKGFKAWWFRNVKNATTKRTEILAKQFANDEVAKNMQLIMGADPSVPLGSLGQ